MKMQLKHSLVYLAALCGTLGMAARTLPSFVAPLSYDAGDVPRSVAVGDFTGDGISDLAVVFSGGVRILLGNGDGTFRTSPISYVAGSGPVSVAVGDFNGDGRPDLAVADNLPVVGDSEPSDVSILDNDGMWPLATGSLSLQGGRHGMSLPTFAEPLPPRPDPLAVPPGQPAAPRRQDLQNRGRSSPGASG